MAANPDLLEFYGTECPHCIEMEPLIKQLQDEEGIEINRFEV
jgi:thiol-disulfide isomerase/thioredoxin